MKYIEKTSHRFLLVTFVFILLTATGAFAQQNSDNSASTGNASKAASADTPKKSEATPSTEERLRALEELVESQQREIKALREDLQKRVAETSKVNNTENSKPQPADLTLSEAKPSAGTEKAESAASSSQKPSADTILPLGFKISGDMRFRGETLANQGFDNPTEQPFRGRLRVRARLNLEGKVTNNFTWGLRLDTNIFTDPVSANQTLTDFYDRKPFALERAFVKYNYQTDKMGIELIGGKFEPTFRRTQMIWDDDLNVEGASEAIYYKINSHLKQIKFVVFELPFNELPGDKDGVLYGGQFQTDWEWSRKFKANVDIGYYDWVRADQVLRGLGAAATQVDGGISNGSGTTGGQNGALGTTNRIIRDANGNPVGFLANFNLLDVLAKLTWQASDRYPIILTLDYVHNLSHRIDNEQNGYWAGIQIGRDIKDSKKNDWLLGYTFTRIQQDAVLVPFNFSDILASNSRAHVPTVGYKIADNVALQWTGLFSQRVNRVFPLSDVNRWLNRMQFDVTYIF